MSKLADGYRKYIAMLLNKTRPETSNNAETILLNPCIDDSVSVLLDDIVIVMIQVIYIRLLVKSVSVKEEMHLQENDLQQLIEYNHELENNMENIRNIKHDIKNLFLTMGGFVDKSGDEEMKAFYERNIVPFCKAGAAEKSTMTLYIK